MSITGRNNVVVSGAGDRPIIFAHGFGCDQTMWRDVAPNFERDYRVVTYDLTGAGASDLSAYDFDRYSALEAHAEDLVKICGELNLSDAILVGHSISASIAILAANSVPDYFSSLVLISPSPSFLDDESTGYTGGFSREDIEELVAFMDENYLGWSEQMAPVIAGQPAGEPAADDLTRGFCRTDPQIAAHFGRVTFLSDRREDMRRSARPSLVLHCDDDPLVPMPVAEWMRDNIPGATVEVMSVTGHCPHMTAPEQTVAAIRRYLKGVERGG